MALGNTGKLWKENRRREKKSDTDSGLNASLSAAKCSHIAFYDGFLLARIVPCIVIENRQVPER